MSVRSVKGLSHLSKRLRQATTSNFKSLFIHSLSSSNLEKTQGVRTLQLCKWYYFQFCLTGMMATKFVLFFLLIRLLNKVLIVKQLFSCHCSNFLLLHIVNAH